MSPTSPNMLQFPNLTSFNTYCELGVNNVTNPNMLRVPHLVWFKPIVKKKLKPDMDKSSKLAKKLDKYMQYADMNTLNVTIWT